MFVRSQFVLAALVLSLPGAAGASKPKASTTTSATAPAAPTAAAPTAAAPAAPAGPASAAVLPSAVSPKYAKETAGKSRMHTCLDQYKANKAANANGGMEWIQKGGGYYSVCSKKLKGEPAAAHT